MVTDVRINNVALSGKRLAQIEAAETLSDAQRMGLMDRFVDWCRGGVKSEAIKQAFDLLRSPAGESAAQHAGHVQHENMLLHFSALHEALRPEHAGKCQLTVQRDDAQQTWSYRMVLDGKPLVSANNLPMQSGYTLAAFEDYAMLAALGSHLQERYGADSASHCNVLREKFFDINARLQGQPSSILLEKFRIISDDLLLLGAPSKGCFPAVGFSHDLSNADLFIGSHQLGRFDIVNQEVLTDMLSTMAHVCASAVNHMLQARDTRAEVFETLQDMVDDINERRIMEENIFDPFFCRENFVSAQAVEGDDSKFSATFRDKNNGKEKVLLFSNRVPSNMELRGEILQSKLDGSAYSSLGDLIAQRFGTLEDSQIAYLSTPARFGFTNFLGSLDGDPVVQNRLGFLDEVSVAEYFQNFKESVIAPMKIGHTTLGEVWGLKETVHGKMTRGSSGAHIASAALAPAPQSSSLEEPNYQSMLALLAIKA